MKEDQLREIESKIEDLEALRMEAIDKLNRRQRELQLMEAGLKERPLDRDFYNGQVQAFKLTKKEHEHMDMLFTIAKKIKNRGDMDD